MNKLITSILVAMMFATSLVAQTGAISTKQIRGNADLTYTGGATPTGLPAAAVDATDAASKQYVDDNTGTTQSSQSLVSASDTITPGNTTVVINLLETTAAAGVGVTFNHTFSNGTTANTFGTADGVGTTEAGSPVVAGGVLDLTNGNSLFETSAVSWQRHDGSGSNHEGLINPGASMSIRILFRPNWDGDPTSSVGLLFISNGSTAATLANTCQLTAESGGQVRFLLTQSTGAQFVNVSSNSDFQWRSGELYEVEINIDWEVSVLLFWDGHTPRFGSDGSPGTGAWFSSVSANEKIILGGEDGTGTDDEAPNFSNHTVEGFTIWSSSTLDVRAHTTATEYQPTYLPDGVQNSFETITKIVGSTYEVGDEVQFVNKTGGEGYELVPSTSSPPGLNELEIERKFTARNDNDWLKGRWNGTFWEEVDRHFEDPGGTNGPGVDAIALTDAATTLVLKGGEKANLTGSETALSSQVTFKIDFSDNLCEADFAAGMGEAIAHCHPTVRGLGGVVDPIISGGLLDMNTTGEQTSVATFRADGANGEMTNPVGAIRIMFQPNFTGNPSTAIGIMDWRETENQSCTENASSAACDRELRIFFESDGELRANIYDSSGTISGFLVTTGYVPAAGVTAEIEVNWDFTTPAYRLFVDGTLEDTDVADTGVRTGGLLEKPFFGLGGRGVAGVGRNSIFGNANHKYEGFAVFNAVQHTASYTATGLPGVTTSDETIDKITGSGVYREGQRLALECREPNRFQFTDTASPVADQMELNGDWDCAAVGENLDLVRSNARWIETGRFPAAAGAGSGVGDVVGPAVATDRAVAIFSTTSGKAIQNTATTIDISNNMDIGGNLTVLNSVTAENGSLIAGDGTGAQATLFFDTALAGGSDPEFEWEDNSANHGRGFSLRNKTGARVFFVEGDGPGSNASVLGHADEQINLDATDRDYFMGFGRRGTSSASRGINLNLGTQTLLTPYDDAVDGEYTDFSNPGPTYFLGGPVVANGTFNGSAFNGSTAVGIATPGEILMYAERGIRWVPDQGGVSGDPDDQSEFTPAMTFGVGVATFHNRGISATWFTTTAGNGNITAAAGAELAAHYDDAAMPMYWYQGTGLGTRTGPLIVGYSASFTADEPMVALAYEDDLTAGTKRFAISWGSDATKREFALEENTNQPFFDLTAPLQAKRYGLGANDPITLGVAASVLDPTDDTGYVFLTGDGGGNTVATITSTGFSAGDRLVVFVVTDNAGTLTFTDSGTGATADQMNLAGTLTVNADDTFELLFEGTHWVEMSRSLN